MTPARIAIAAALACAALALTPVASGYALLDQARMQVTIESRIITVENATLPELGVGSATLRCAPGQVALSAGYTTDVFGVGLVTSIPTGPRGWELALANSTATAVEVAGSVLCARILSGPRLVATTGRAAVTVPAGEVLGTAFVPGTATVKGTCAKGSVPVAGGLEQTGEPSVTIGESFPSGKRSWEVEVRNVTLEVKPAVVAIRCVNGSEALRVQLVLSVAQTPPATEESGTVDPGEAEGTRKCGAGKVLLGAGFRLGENVYADSFAPVLARVPVLRYLFRSYATQKTKNDLVLICTPTLVPRSD
jgi:Flp pilus assembly secretin CpaC